MRTSTYKAWPKSSETVEPLALVASVRDIPVEAPVKQPIVTKKQDALTAANTAQDVLFTLEITSDRLWILLLLLLVLFLSFRISSLSLEIQRYKRVM